ncbi:hypothetical protein RUM44_008358 [Polyplax serrata]|uniref:Trafficking protein particle complex subunit 11 n=1 Tax=Polyplax serrata TaxID=468196 RepID=A0ABR1B835_POLSC
MAVSDPLGFPPELYSKPSALVGLCGLDIQNNSLHRSIWDVFRTSHERSSITCKLFGLSHSFPPVKAKRTTYDWHIPKGLFKRNWMKKHLLEIPAVVALLFDLNWEDANAEQLKAQCCAYFQGLRTALGNHATKMVIILIQKVAPLPDDTKAAEKAKLLCAACDIEPKQLYVLPLGDHLQGYISRLENVLSDLAQNYYHQEIIQVKQHKDQLNKTTQQYLFVRHQFKLGFLSELKQDNHNASKYYNSAYTLLKGVRLSDTNIVEVKLIAGFIIYKVCYLMFKLNRPRDAISNFKFHIEYYKDKIGAKDLYFEHLNWLSKQYSAFGDIFNEAVKQGLNAVQTQHPGFYYQLAAQCAIDRKNSAMELCKNVTAYPASDPLKGLNSLEFYGQRPWRPGKLSAEPINPSLEMDGINALKYRENLVNHSGIIIHLLGSAISQFKTYKCPRMRLQLVVQMADEYFCSKEYGQALTLFSHILWDYKDEKWWLLLSKLLSKALSCAYVAANVQDYINFSLEALGPLAKFDTERRQKIFNNLMSVLQFKTPEPEPEIPEQSVVQAQNSWEATKRVELQSPPIEMSARSCIEARARFTKPVFGIDEVITVEIYLRSSCPYPIQFSHLAVVMSTSNCSSENPVPVDKENLKLNLGEVKKLIYEYKGNPADIGKMLQINSVLLTIGFVKERSATLKFVIAQGVNDLPVEKTSDEFQFYRLSISDPCFDKIESLSSAKLVASESKVKLHLKHDSPALLSEWYPIEVTIFNDEESTIVDSVLEVKFQSSDDLTIEQTTQLCTDVKNCIPMSVIEIPLESIKSKETKVVIVYMRGHRIGERNLVIKLCYNHEKESATLTKSSVDTLVKVPIIQPFEVSADVLSMKFEQIDKCFSRNPFILNVNVHVLSPWPIKVHHSTIKPSSFVKFCDEKVTSQLTETVLNQSEGGSDMFPLVIDKASDQPVALGVYTLQWSRLGTSEITSSSVTMPTIMCDPTILGVEMSLPAHGWVRKPMELEYNLYSYSNNVLQLDLFMESSDAFMFAGEKQILIHLLPGSIKKLTYNLYPLFSGLVALPRLVFRSPSEELMEQLNLMIDRNLLSHIYVMPQDKLGIQDEASVNSG